MNDLEVKDNIKELTIGMQRVLYILENDNKTGSKGLVGKVDDLEENMQDLIINNKARNIFYGASAGAAIGIIGWFLRFILTKEV